MVCWREVNHRYDDVENNGREIYSSDGHKVGNRR